MKISIVLLLLLATATLSEANPFVRRGFSARDIRGSYGFSFIGALNTGDGFSKAVSTGVLDFVSDKTCEFTVTVNFEGGAPPVFPASSTSCAFEVNESGMGTISVVGDPPLNTIELAFTIVDDARELRVIRTDGAVGLAEGSAIRQRKSRW